MELEYQIAASSVLRFVCNMQMAKFELTRISNRVRFILAVIAGEVVISNRKRANIEEQLDEGGYDRMPNTKKACHHT